MGLRAPNIAVLVVSALLAMAGVLSASPIAMPLLGLTYDSAPWYIFLGWFLLAAGSALPETKSAETKSAV
jgi:hypothetical protein